MRKVLLAAAAAVLAGCAASPNSDPNFIQRAQVLSSTPKGISVAHSRTGSPIAFRLAAEHCSRFNKTAHYEGGVREFGADVLSTWRCEE